MSPYEVIVGTLFFGACIFALALFTNHALTRLQGSALSSTRVAANVGSEEVFVVRRESAEGQILEQISRRSETLRAKK
jgi:hypothetical protein